MSSLTARPRVLRPRAGTLRTAWAPNDLDAPVAGGEDGFPLPPADPAAEAYAQGYEEGRAAGERGERARLRSAARAVEEALQSIESSEERWSGAVEENTVALAVATARHLLDHAIEVDPALVLGIVRRALAEFPIDQPLKIRVNPNDLAIIEMGDENGHAVAFDSPDRVAYWTGDARVAPGGCVVEGRERIVDGRVDTALERLHRRLSRRNA